ncbi:uncharacterized protein LOC134446689 [Engraulis encrasicolus]|uniref:uncharacterized protein LOC134446689 n=1 Tax=Engraulis encrasicolus TaxID=184585 RepID=UPI002FD243F2
MPADMKVQRRMSRKTNKMFDDRRSSTKGDFVRAKEKEHMEEVEEEKKKTETEIVTAEESKSSREVHYATPKASKRKKKLASKKRINFSAAGRPHFSTDNPLLYAYRKACIDSLDMSSSTGLASMLKHESRLLPFDSGFMSLENQEVSKQLPAAGQGGLVPIGQKPKRVFSKAHKLTSQHVYQPPHPSPQHHLGPTQYDVIGQPRHDITSQHSDIIAQRYDMQHPHTVHHDDDGVHYPRDHRDVHFQHCHDNNLQGHYVTTQHYDIIITSQRPCDAIRSEITPSLTPGRTEHAQGPCYPPRPPVSQAPHSSPQHDPKPRPHEASPAADQLVEQGKALEQGDAGQWRESLHKLISLHGFRSCKAAQAAASLQQQQARSKTAFPPLRSKTALPPLRYQPPGSAVPGERVLEKVELTGQDGGSSTSSSFMPPLQFQQQIPLSWRLSHASLKPRGQMRYGRLEMDWVSGGARSDIASATLKTPTLPKIKPRPRRRTLTQA